jgi:hypothetical protein
MPTSINYPSDAKGKWSLPTMLALISLAILSFLVYVPPSKSKLLDTLTSRLREEKFEKLYYEARDSVRRNVPKEKFVRRMKAAVAKLKTVDPGLNFQKDPMRESLYSEDASGVLFSALKLERDGKSVLVFIIWDSEGLFSDLSVTPGPEMPEEYNVYSVSCQSLNVGGQPTDY